MIGIQTVKVFFIYPSSKKACLDVANFGHSEQMISEPSIDEGTFVFLYPNWSIQKESELRASPIQQFERYEIVTKNRVANQ